MRIKKYDFNYGRRQLMGKTAHAAAAAYTAGVLAPLWPMIGNAADITKAYPEELLSIDAYTKGKIKTGDYITAENVDIVKDMIDPIAYEQIKNMGRRIKIRPTTTDTSKLFGAEYLEATLRNQGQATFDEAGNIRTKDGKPWIGGNPFPDPKDAHQAIANLTLSWGRNDYTLYAIRERDLNPDGNVAYNYDFIWSELAAANRLDGTIFRDDPSMLRYQTVFFTSTRDVAGSSFLNNWHYDQRKFPDLYGYLPQFRRVRQFPTNQRFEPLIPGVTWILSDAWAAGDPMLTWGNYKVVGSKPWLGAVSGNWRPDNNRETPVHGGPQGQSFFDTEFEMIPEVLVLDAEPTEYPRAPVGKKRIWVDVRNGMFLSYVRYDRNGKPWVSFEAGFGQQTDGDAAMMEASGKSPVWTWNYVLAHDIQGNRISLIDHVDEVTGGYKSHFDADPEEAFDRFFTQQAITRLGQV
ncbi:DUF1329 domain-containing protein [Algiphilus sp.]|uniref:DUF1329 domain-containing protein n=1 Tax=Algiphilus sp. TaxID=1872431 RepID=UPI003B520AAA